MADQDSTLTRVLAIVAIVYLLILGALLVAPLFMARAEYVGLAASALSLMLFPALILLPIYLLLRRWRWAALLIVPFIAFFVSYGPVLLTNSNEVPADTAELQVLTFNIQRANTPDKLDTVASIIREADADVVGVQELSAFAADHLQNALQDTYPHTALYGRESGHLGQGIFSKYPIAASEFWRNPVPEPGTPLGQMWADIDVDGRTVTVFSVHPLPPYTTSGGFNVQPHHDAVVAILDRAEQKCGPKILMGDWNMTDEFDDYELVTQTYSDAYREAGDFGFGFTYPNGKRFPAPPLVRVDYIFHNEAFAAADATVIDRSGSSDHQPVHATLALLPEGEVSFACE